MITLINKRMESSPIIYLMFLIFTGAAIMATIALYTRQSLLVAYIVLGIFLGPWGLSLVTDTTLITQIANAGIIFLLFLLGLNLHPQNLLHLLKNTVWVTLLSAVIFAFIGFFISRLFGFSLLDQVIIGLAMMFSSTIIGLKLLPTTVLHHQRTGELVISILLLQDIIAIILILIFNNYAEHEVMTSLLQSLLALPGIVIFCFLIERFVLRYLLMKFDSIKEFVFLIALGWCLGIAQLAEFLGLSYQIGAFIAGVAIATSPIALFIAESLKPLRDFFLVMFFFALGASFNVTILPQVWLPAIILAVLMLIAKPLVFGGFLHANAQTRPLGTEIGIRLGQLSEFSLFLAYIAYQHQLLSMSAFYVIEVTTIMTFIASSYIVVLKYPTPIALSARLRRD